MSMRHDIHQCQPADQQQVVELITQVLKDQQVIPSTADQVDDEDLFQIPAVHQGRSCFWVAKQEGKVISTVANYEVNQSTCQLHRMFVATSFPGQWAGQALLDSALGFAGDLGFTEIVSPTHLLMNRAHRFYQKNNFIHLGQSDVTYLFHRSLVSPES